MNSFTDYYETLGIDGDASSSEIKAAFKRLAHQYHPDVYKGEDAHERMRALLLAYQTLNDPEARRQYDMQRSEHFLSGRSSSVVNSSGGQTARPVSRHPNRTASEVSPTARRDRQRHYDFPDISSSSPVHIDLIDMAYMLSESEARTLLQQGMLRGEAPETEDHDYYCHRCRHRWHAPSARNRADETALPLFCPRCHASDWMEYLLLRCVNCRAVFESEQIRYEIGSYSYGKGRYSNSMSAANLCPPYELFPLCPYCGKAHWCPAEDARVEELRLRSARRAALMRMVWVALTIFAIIILGVVALGMMH